MVHSIWKKGSLNLSIEAIVILIMAITMLGLGLGFIRDKFGNAGNLISDVQQKVREDVQRDLSNSNKKVSFPKTEFKLASGDSEVALVGIKNDGDAKQDFFVSIEMQDSSGDMVSWDNPSLGTPLPGDFTFSSTYDQIAPGAIQLIPIKIRANPNPATTKASYIYKLSLCTGDPCGTSNSKVFATKNFFLKII
ncbi:MAG: hypothetical protein GXP63_04495 [DPANN group archaeon]|nr:hypothetical protein [DPANN group archaeon]